MLSENWITDKTTDFEYKKYTVLAYLQSVYNSFSLKELYPVLPSLDDRHNQLELFIKNKQTINQISVFNLKNVFIYYRYYCSPYISPVYDYK